MPRPRQPFRVPGRFSLPRQNHRFSGYGSTMSEPAKPAIRSSASPGAFESIGKGISPYLEDAAVLALRRREQAALLVKEYEDRAGEISEEEIKALESEWLA